MQIKQYTLIAVTAIAVIMAIVVSISAEKKYNKRQHGLLFPNLAVDTVEHILIKRGAKSVALNRQDGKNWYVEAFDNYPALTSKVNTLILDLKALNINALKTALPKNYYRLGVEDPHIGNPDSLLLQLKDHQQNTVAEIIVGKTRHSRTTQNNPGLYVRKPDDKQSYLVNGKLELTARNQDWIERALFNIPSDNIQQISVSHTSGDQFTLYKSQQGQENFEYLNISTDKKLASEIIVNRFASLLQDMEISGAKTFDASLWEPQVTASIKTFSGATISIQVMPDQGITYAKFDFMNVTETDLPPEILESLQNKTQKWVFFIPEFKYDILKKRTTELLHDK